MLSDPSLMGSKWCVCFFLFVCVCKGLRAVVVTFCQLSESVGLEEYLTAIWRLFFSVTSLKHTKVHSQKLSHAQNKAHTHLGKVH